MSKIGIIGGSGIYKIDGVSIIKEHNVNTPFGKPSCPVMEAEVEGKKFYFIARHGLNHSLSPSDVNYRANIFAMKSVGVNQLVSLTAVGSLKEGLSPRMFFLPDQYIDWTKGIRKRTFFEDGIVGHVSVANPIDMGLRDIVEEACKQADISYDKDGAYICIEGPQFSSKAESNIYRKFGASVIGMTNVPEAYLAKEAGMAYATVAMVTDYDCWKEEHCTVDEIMKVAHDNQLTAQRLVKVLIPMLEEKKYEVETENSFAVVTSKDLHTMKHKEILDVVLR